jgi:glutamate/tyrosine decarboxylase-like PLP-dependent enzyme
MPNAPVYRSVCGNVWFHVDAASGAILERLDPSRRAYRWLYSGLHTMDFPMLSAHPTLRAALIVILCGCGFVFSLTGVVIGWRRLRLRFAPNRPAGARSVVS